MSEYGWTVEYTLSRPLGQCFALQSQCALRYGNKPKGPTYRIRAILKAMGLLDGESTDTPAPPRK
jgi:hypothetical protein